MRFKKQDFDSGRAVGGSVAITFTFLDKFCSYEVKEGHAPLYWLYWIDLPHDPC